MYNYKIINVINVINVKFYYQRIIENLSFYVFSILIDSNMRLLN